jgi:tetratricopeptide (TPR) repeat protein
MTDAPRDEPQGPDTPSASPPGGEAYDWYHRGLALLESGNPEAAAQLLEHAVNAEPDARSAQEALARAQFDARRYEAASQTFRSITESDPSDHYARFGLGLALYRLGQTEAAVEHLAMAEAMRPDIRHYAQALRDARATLRLRSEGL